VPLSGGDNTGGDGRGRRFFGNRIPGATRFAAARPFAVIGAALLAGKAGLDPGHAQTFRWTGGDVGLAMPKIRGFTG
jgi:hypothetical protein